jgi:hypothetical protein
MACLWPQSPFPFLFGVVSVAAKAIQSQLAGYFS